MDIKKILSLFHDIDGRSRMLGKNVIASFILKAISILCSLVIVPLTLNYLKGDIYGIWLTMTSILFWFSYFDIGLGNGMRNYLSQAISNHDLKLGRAYISTTLALLLGIVLLITIFIIIALPFINWNTALNTSALTNSDLRNILIVAIFFTLITFILKNIGVIFMSLQKFAMNDFLVVSGNVLSLFLIFLLTKFTSGNLLYATLAFTVSPVLVFGISSVPVFKKYSELKPSIHAIDMNLSKNIIGKGLSFFFIQITSCLVIYGSSNVFIAQYCGTSQVTVYNIAYKYFNLLVMAYTIMISPLWNAYTDAYEKKEMLWIKKSFYWSVKICLLLCCFGLVMLVISNWFYHVWIGDAVKVSLPISVGVLIYVCFYNLNNCATSLLNGLNMIRVQLFTSIFVTLLYFVIVHYLGTHYGTVGISLSMGLCYALMSVIHLYQCKIIINGKASGIWVK